MRQKLVSNKPLYAYAEAYGMPSQMRTGRRQERNPKAVADCFEAYIGAVVLEAETVDQGLDTLRDWLGKLFEPKIEEMAAQRSTVAAVDKMAKQTLNAIAGGRGATLEYKWTDGAGGNKGGYWITVLLNGWGCKDKILGKGWGASKSDAELRAAMNVLADTQMVADLRAIKEKVMGPRPVKNATGEAKTA